MTRTISFTLNGEPVAAEIKPHHNLVEVLQREFNLMSARESCGQGMCGCCPVDAIKPDTEAGLEKWLGINDEYARVWPNITVKA